MSERIVFVALQQFGEYGPRPLQLLHEAGVTVRRNTVGRRLRREDMVTALQDVDAVLAGVEPYDADILAQLPRLQCISRCGVGTEAIDLEAARRQGICVYTTTEEVVEPVAQLTLAMILALARNLPQHLGDARAGQWVKRSGVLLSEWTIGLIGFGRIGQAVERSLRAFGPRILVADPHRQPAEMPSGVELISLDEVLARADLVSLHAAGWPEKGPLLGPREFSMMKPGSRLVNTARGFLVDEVALESALRTGRLSAAALDVFEEEPYTGSLGQLPNVLATPHVATLTRASRAQMEWRCAHHVVRHFMGQVVG